MNTNVYCRPFDDLEQKRILEEAVAASKVFLWANARLISLFASEVVLAEILLIDNIYKKDAVEYLISNLPIQNIRMDKKIISLADKLFAKRIIDDYMDVLHISSAAIGNAEYFLTCDDEILQKADKFTEFLKNEKITLIIENPLQFVKDKEV
ncbi:MAG: hypothetical protein ACPL4K_01255 [Candidatus Margulisiibacteriota bacterium]